MVGPILGTLGSRILRFFEFYLGMEVFGFGASEITRGSGVQTSKFPGFFRILNPGIPGKFSGIFWGQIPWTLAPKSRGNYLRWGGKFRVVHFLKEREAQRAGGCLCFGVSFRGQIGLAWAILGNFGQNGIKHPTPPQYLR